MKVFVFLLSFVLAGSVWAKESVKTFFTSDASHYFVSYQEDNAWKLDHIKVEPGKMQERVSHDVFINEQQLKFVLKNKMAKYRSAMSPQDKPYFNYVETELASRYLWKAKNTWSEEWEKRYMDWILNEFDANFFVTYELKTDCADVAYLLRWIFARENSLPIATRLSGTGTYITHESMKSEWRNLPTSEVWHEDQQFRAVLNYIANHTYTHTLFRATYPVKITREALAAGTIYLTLSGSSGHTRIVARTNWSDTGPIPMTMFSSTLPREIRPLYEEAVLSLSQPGPKAGGFRRMRWTTGKRGKWMEVPREDHSFYSTEQYSEEYKDEGDSFIIKIYKKLIPGYDPLKAVKVAFQDLVDYVGQRIDVVKDGFQFCQQNDCSPGTSAWEDWSTPSRDKRIMEKVSFIENLIRSYMDIEVLNKWEKLKSETTYQVTATHSFTLGQIITLWNGKLFSSDPRVSIARRWALDKSAVKETIVSRFTKIFKERSQKIKDGLKACRTVDCSPGSEGFNEWGTFAEDATLKEMASSYMNYCWEMKYSCTWRQDNDPIKVNNKQVPLSTLIKRIGWFIPEPEAPAPKRWGEHSEQFSFTILDKTTMQADQHQVDHNGLVSDYKGNLFDVVKKIRYHPPEVCSEFRNIDNSELYLCQVGVEIGSIDYYIFSKTTGYQAIPAPTPLTSNLELKTFIGNYLVLGYSHGEVYFYEISSTGFNLVMKENGHIVIREPDRSGEGELEEVDPVPNLAFAKGTLTLDRFSSFQQNYSRPENFVIEHNGQFWLIEIKGSELSKEALPAHIGETVPSYQLMKWNRWIFYWVHDENSDTLSFRFYNIDSQDEMEWPFGSESSIRLYPSLNLFVSLNYISEDRQSIKVWHGLTPNQLSLIHSHAGNVNIQSSLVDSKLYFNYMPMEDGAQKPPTRFHAGIVETFRLNPGESYEHSEKNLVYLSNPPNTVSMTDFDRSFILQTNPEAGFPSSCQSFWGKCRSQSNNYVLRSTLLQNSSSFRQSIHRVTDTNLTNPLMSFDISLGNRFFISAETPLFGTSIELGKGVSILLYP